MDINIIEVDFGSPAFDELLALRDKLLRKPLNLVYYEKDIALEYMQTHLVAYADTGLLLGGLTLQPKENGVLKMRQVVVDTEIQGKGVGKALVKASERWASDHNYRSIILHARDTAVPFYLHLNYNKLGEEFEEVNIKHWAMEKIIQ